MVPVDDVSALTAAEELAESLVDIVGAAVRSVILHGSLATGDFRAGRSDIDVLVIVDHGLTDTQVDAVEDRVRHADIGSAAGVDLHVVTADIARTPTRTPPLELHIGRYDRSFADASPYLGSITPIVML